MARSHREHVGTRTAGIEDGRQTHRVAWNTQVYAAAGVQTTRALQMNHESGEFWKFSPERLRVANRRRSRTDKPTTRLPRPRWRNHHRGVWTDKTIRDGNHLCRFDC